MASCRYRTPRAHAGAKRARCSTKASLHSVIATRSHHEEEGHLALDSRWRLCRVQVQACTTREYMDTSTTPEYMYCTCTAPGTSSHHCETQHAEPSHLQHTTYAASTSLRQTPKLQRIPPPARLGERERVGRLAHLECVQRGLATFLYRTAVACTLCTRYLFQRVGSVCKYV